MDADEARADVSRWRFADDGATYHWDGAHWRRVEWWGTAPNQWRYVDPLKLNTQGGRIGNFTKEEAEAKVGKLIKTRVEFSGVPAGTTGKVVEAENMGSSLVQGKKEDVWDVVIEWEQEPRVFGTQLKALRDWFSKDEYEQYLEEVS